VRFDTEEYFDWEPSDLMEVALQLFDGYDPWGRNNATSWFWVHNALAYMEEQGYGFFNVIQGPPELPEFKRGRVY
jgi:hypothetical protein